MSNLAKPLLTLPLLQALGLAILHNLKQTSATDVLLNDDYITRIGLKVCENSWEILKSIESSHAHDFLLDSFTFDSLKPSAWVNFKCNTLLGRQVSCQSDSCKRTRAQLVRYFKVKQWSALLVIQAQVFSVEVRIQVFRFQPLLNLVKLLLLFLTMLLNHFRLLD